jgi:hypothetical protein
MYRRTMGICRRWVVMATLSALAGAARADGPHGAGQVTGDGPPGYVHITFDDDASGLAWEAAQLLANDRIPATFFFDVDKLRLLSKDESDTLLEVTAREPERIGLFVTQMPARVRRSAMATLDELSALSAQAVTLYRADTALSEEGRRALATRRVTEVTSSIATADLETRDPTEWGTKVIDRIARANGGVVRIHTAKTKPALTSAHISALVAALVRENCKRRAAGMPMLVAAPIDFFIRDGDAAREVPAPAKASVTAYLATLEAKCVVILEDAPQTTKHLRTSKACVDNPLGKGCS